LQVNFTTKIGPFALADGPISFRDLFHIPFVENLILRCKLIMSYNRFMK